jgi:tRNA(Ile)-lysidine synthase
MRLISRKTNARIELFLSPLEVMERVILRRTLRRAINETRGLRGINFIHIEDIIDLIKKGKTGGRLYLPHDIRAIKDYSTLILTSEPPVKLDTYTLEVPGELVLKEAGVFIKASFVEPSDFGEKSQGVREHAEFKTLAILDAEKMIFPLVVRPRKRGDFFYPLGFGKKKKLQDFFVDEKVPRDERDAIPLIVSGEDIIWVVGYRGDERFRITDETKKILKLEVKKLK